MEKEEVVKVKENNINTPLMRKTKAQLIDIILRKDSVEKELRDEIKNKDKKVYDLNHKYTQLTEDINDYDVKVRNLEEYNDKLKRDNNEIKIDYEDICDKYATDKVVYRKSSIKKDNLVFALSIMLLFSVIINFILYFT